MTRRNREAIDLPTAMSVSEHTRVLEKLRSFELREPVQEYEVGGLHAWPLLRINIAWKAVNPAHGKRKKHTARRFGSVFRRLKNLLGLTAPQATIQNDGSNNGFHPDSADAEVVLISSADRRVEIANQSWNIITDPFLVQCEKLGIRASVWELGEPVESAVRKPSWISKHLNTTTDEPVPLNEPRWFSRFQAFASAEFGDDRDWQHWANRFSNLLKHTRLFHNWLQLSKCKAVVIDNWYSPVCMAAIAAAKQLGWTTVDLQHGLQSDLHFAYAGWYCNTANFETIPEYAWVWGEKDRRLALTPQSPGMKPVIGGNPWLNGWNSKLTNNCEDTQQLSLWLRGSEKTLVVTLQHNIPIDRLIEEIAHSPTGWRWLIRFHPRTPALVRHEQEQLFESVKREIEWERSSRAPLYALFDLADIHVTGSSTSALEAFRFGLPSVLIHCTGVEAFQEFVERRVMADCTNRSIEAAEQDLTHIEEAYCDAADECFAANHQFSDAIDTLNLARKPGGHDQELDPHRFTCGEEKQ